MARILVAEGDPVERELLCALLSERGHAPLAAGDGDEALATAARERPEAAVVDLLLPRRDGYSVLVHLRSSEATRGIPVAIVSTEPADEHAPIADALGALSYFEKPWRGEELAGALEAALGAAAPAGGKP